MIQYNGGWYCNGCLYTYLAPEPLLDVQVSLDSLAEVAQLSNSRLTGHVHKYNAIQLLSLWVTLPDKAGTAGFLKSWTMRCSETTIPPGMVNLLRSSTATPPYTRLLPA